MRVRKRTALLGRFLTMKLLIKLWPGAFLVGSFFYNVHDFAWASVLSRESHMKGGI